MATPAAQPAINTLLAIGSLGCPITFTTIANIGDMGGPSMDSTVVDVTSHSTADPWRRKIVTLLNSGEIPVPLFFIPTANGHSFTNPEGLGYVFTHREERVYRLTFPDAAATTWYFFGYVSKFSLKAPVAGVLTADVTFTLTGPPIF